MVRSYLRKGKKKKELQDDSSYESSVESDNHDAADFDEDDELGCSDLTSAYQCSMGDFGFDLDEKGEVVGFDTTLLHKSEWKKDMQEWCNFIKHEFDFFDDNNGGNGNGNGHAFGINLEHKNMDINIINNNNKNDHPRLSTSGVSVRRSSDSTIDDEELEDFLFDPQNMKKSMPYSSTPRSSNRSPSSSYSLSRSFSRGGATSGEASCTSSKSRFSFTKKSKRRGSGSGAGSVSSTKPKTSSVDKNNSQQHPTTIGMKSIKSTGNTSAYTPKGSKYRSTKAISKGRFSNRNYDVDSDSYSSEGVRVKGSSMTNLMRNFTGEFTSATLSPPGATLTSPSASRSFNVEKTHRIQTGLKQKKKNPNGVRNNNNPTTTTTTPTTPKSSSSILRRPTTSRRTNVGGMGAGNDKVDSMDDGMLPGLTPILNDSSSGEWSRNGGRSKWSKIFHKGTTTKNY